MKNKKTDMKTHSELFDVLKESFILFKKTFYKNFILQSVFKLFYFSIIILLIQNILKIIFFVLDLLESQKILVLDFFISILRFESVLVFFVAVTIIVAVFYVERNAQIIIANHYYTNKNNFKSYYSILKKSILYVPKVIFIKIKELKNLKKYLFLGIILWLFLLFTILNENLLYWIEISLIIFILVFGITIYLRRVFITYNVCLYPNESALNFNKNTSKHYLKLRKKISIIYYTTSYLIFGLILFGMYLYSKTIINLAEFIPELILAQLIAFLTVFNALIVFLFFILTSAGIISIYTILYYRERKSQNRIIIKTNKKSNKRIFFDFYLSKKFKFVFFSIFSLIIIGFYIVLSVSFYSQILETEEIIKLNLNNNVSNNFNGTNNLTLNENDTKELTVKKIIYDDPNSEITFFKFLIYLKNMNQEDINISQFSN